MVEQALSPILGSVRQALKIMALDSFRATVDRTLADLDAEIREQVKTYLEVEAAKVATEILQEHADDVATAIDARLSAIAKEMSKVKP